MDLNKAIKNSMDFTFNTNNFAAMFAYRFISMLVLIEIFLFGGLDLKAVTLAGIRDSFLNVWWAFGLFIIAAIIAGLYVPILFTISYGKKSTLKASAKQIGGKLMINYVIVLIIIGFISGIVGTIPIIGFLFSILASLAFYFVTQILILSKNNPVESVKDSWNLFRSRKFDTFVAALIGGVIIACIIILFLLPLLGALWPTISFVFTKILIPSALNDTEPSFASIPPVDISQMFLPAIVALLGSVISSLFSIAYKTEVYLQLKKR